jgi:ferredoxin
LPANVLPVAVNAVGQCGIETLTAARVYGATRTLILVPPGLDDDVAALNEAAALGNLIMETLGYSNGATDVINERDPEALAALLRTAAASAKDGPAVEAFSPYGRKRDLLSLSLAALYSAAPTPVDQMALPAGAPFGTLDIDVPNCTLCMACVGVCPANALRDNPDHPRLSFVESACVQCGLCAKTCPEKVITLRPRLDFTGAARDARTIKEEEPFECVSCGKPFATRTMIATIQERMRTHSMFGNEKALRRLQMCGECRVIDLAESADDPFKSKPRAVPRTTDDYLRERELGIEDDDDGK